MLQFVVLGDEAEAARTVICQHVPFTVGRSSSSDLQVTGPGVWEEHARVVSDPGTGKFVIQPVGEALVLINGESSPGKVLLPNDEIHLGAIVLKVSLAPVEQRNLRTREGFVWALIGFVVLIELVLLLEI